MDFAPGNDPFVITVGAADTLDTETVADDSIAPWSAWGHTADGFAKPELSAPGRYMIGAVPDGATMMRERPDHVVAPGYMQLSGTSFAAPVVAGVAANLLALHASWTPDQVKGALMSTAHQLTSLPNTLATGVGEIDERAAAELATPPNANAALDRFVVADSTAAAGVSFADQSWVSAASADMSWASQSWSDMSWASQSWSDMSWASQSWSDSSQADAALADMSWASSSRVD
jgi:serine protease AprX